MNHLALFRPLPSRARGTLFVLALALAGSGCASSYRFTIDAVRHPASAGERAAYVLVDRTEPGSVTPLEFANAARDVRTALSSKGLFEAPAGVTPEFEVELDFSLEGPVQRELTHTEPVYWSASSAPRVTGRAGADDRGGTSLPRKIGERSVTTITTVYPKFLRLTARASRASGNAGPPPVLWSVVVTNEDESSDLTRYVRLMAAAAMDAITQDTGAERKVVLTNRDGRVVFIEQGV